MKPFLAAFSFSFASVSSAYEQIDWLALPACLEYVILADLHDWCESGDSRCEPSMFTDRSEVDTARVMCLADKAVLEKNGRSLTVTGEHNG